MTTGGPTYGFHATKPYGLVLLPYLVVSLTVHAGVAGSLAYKRLARTSTNTGAIEHRRVPERSPDGRREAILKGEPIRRYRLQFLADALIPLDLPPPEPIPEIKPPEPDPVPKPPVPKPPAPEVTPSQLTPPPVDPNAANQINDTLAGMTGFQGGEIFNDEGESLNIGEFDLFTVRDQAIHTHTDFFGWPTIYIVADLSTEKGLADIFNWMRFYHDLLHMPGVIDPPRVVGVGVALEDPFFLTTGSAEDALTSRWDDAGIFGGPLWADVGYDADQQFADNLALEELPQPKVYLADQNGDVHVIITGRLEDLEKDKIEGIATEIKRLWQMSEFEYMAAKFVILNWQSQLKKGELNDPISTDGDQIQLVPPPPIMDPDALSPDITN